ncbi:uncharacterized protein LOC110113008 [Dendrobium catenatum]|uniref:uncharacterized protein LOC110113008 n=1 Tax=Dendrobium catenatum TaxID=906689 RepID=UPI00109FC0FE|nr:uncharacterized protein LOC110113008 [Dendrobium catenatum]
MNSNWIHHIKNRDGIISEEESVIQNIFFSDFFKMKWQHRVCSLDGWPNPSKLISSEDQGMLDADFTREELQLVVDNSERNISPGLDGITFSFMKDFWNVIKDDVWAAVFQFLSSCTMEQFWKETLIVLIPKIKCPQEPSHFWPISLCMTIYKVIAKMLLNRLDKVIHKLISVDQAAFIKGRSLSEHVLVAQEIFNKFRWSKSNGGLLAIKLDMEQAYDSMGWDALRINRGISIFRLAPKISHLLFADDILIFSEAKVKDVKELRRIINNYCDWTGQKVNHSKSMILFGKNTRKRVQRKMIKLLKFKKVKEINYLGIKMALRRLGPSDFENLLDLAAGRLNTWGSKNISLEGRLVLWNFDKLKEAFGSHPIDIISNIPIDKSKRNDQLELIEKFSGKSITALASTANMNHVERRHWEISVRLRLSTFALGFGSMEMLAVLYLKNVIQEWMFEAQGVII